MESKAQNFICVHRTFLVVQSSKNTYQWRNSWMTSPRLSLHNESWVMEGRPNTNCKLNSLEDQAILSSTVFNRLGECSLQIIIKWTESSKCLGFSLGVATCWIYLFCHETTKEKFKLRNEILCNDLVHCHPSMCNIKVRF